MEKAARLVEAALGYAARGWPVIPINTIDDDGLCSCGSSTCRSPGKHPVGALVPHGLKDATVDPATIKRWWRDMPDANVAIITGERSGLFVLDVDAEHGGLDELARLEAEQGTLPATPRSQTGGGGHHDLFTLPADGRRVRNSASKIGPGLDLRGEGGYIVAPPSSHSSGMDYTWVVPPGDVPLAPPPSWLLAACDDPSSERVAGVRPARPAAADEDGEPDEHDLGNDAIAEGARNSTLTSLGGTMRRRGMKANEIAAALQEVNASRCAPPLDRDEVDAIASSVARYEPTGRRKGSGGGRGPSQATLLVDLTAGMELFHTPRGEAFGVIPVRDHHEIWAIRGGGFERWLRGAFYREEGKAAGRAALEAGLGVIEAMALFDGPEEDVYIRIAPGDGAIYLDLADQAWRAVRVTPMGWEIVPEPPVRFRRAAGMLPLPEPVAGGTVDLFRPFVNVTADSDFTLLVAAVAAMFNPGIPYPVLEVSGEQGSAKTTVARMIRELVDPNFAPVRSAPQESRDLVIAASNSWVVSLDNISFITPKLSDDLCRLSTGGGLATRKLYTDADEAIFDVRRPVILNGIADNVTRSDLLDRRVGIHLPPIPQDRRRPEGELWASFRAERPKILGAMLDAVAGALRELPSVTLARSPRMADFARWGTAVERALGWNTGDFLNAYQQDRAAAHEIAIESSPIGPYIPLILAVGDFEGTPAELLNKLTGCASSASFLDGAEGAAGVDPTKARGWPRTPSGLSAMLRRLAPDLRAEGIEVEWIRTAGSNSKRIITVSRSPEATVATVAPVAPASGPSRSPEEISDEHRAAAEEPLDEEATTATGCDGCDGDPGGNRDEAADDDLDAPVDVDPSLEGEGDR